jgi:tetratricopeptide (TPR) repeat protein
MTLPPETHVRPRRRRLRPILAAVLVLLGLAIAAGVLIVTWRPSRRAALARRAFAAGRYAEARTKIGQWLAVYPHSAEAHLLLARTALALGFVDEARRESQRAKELGASRPDLDVFQAIIDAHQGRLPQAEPVLRRAFEEARTPDPQVDEALARVYLRTFQLQRAAAVLDRWARDQPSDPRPYLWRAEVDFRSEGQTEALIRDYREALKRDPNLAKARFGLAETLGSEHRNAEADAEYRAYMALKPDDPAGCVGAGRNALEMGDREAATRLFDRALALDPKNVDALKERGLLALRHGDHSASLGFFDRAVRLDRYDLNLRHNRGLVLARLGRDTEAKAEREAETRLRAELAQLNDLKSRVTASPRDLDLQIRVAQWMFDHGHDDGGIQWAEKVLHDRPSHTRANRLLAEYYERVGNTGLANFYRLQAAEE